MKRDTLKRFYEIHSWVGIVTAVLIFVICYTGAVSVFGRPELRIWSNHDSRSYEKHTPQVIERLVREHALTIPEEYRDEVIIEFPGVRTATKLYIIFEYHKEIENGRPEHHLIRFEHDPKTLELLSRSEGTEAELDETLPADMATFIFTFHADLHLGKPIGLLLTGLLGLTLFASIVTGVFIHRKILKEAFKFRPFRSFRLLFTDSHKALGVWGLLFHGVIGFTGAFLGLTMIVLLPAAAYVSFSGDQEALVAKFFPTHEPEKSGIYSEIRIADIIETVNSSGDYGKISFLTIMAASDKNAQVTLNTMSGPDDMAGKTLIYKVENTEKVDEYTTFSRIGGLAGPMLDAMYPLHFGTFGGIAIKFLWFILGLSTALLSVTGAMIWVERRTFGAVGKLSMKTYDSISRFTAGACCGLVLAVGSLFYAQLLVRVPGYEMEFYLASTFFVVWIAGILWGAFAKNSYRIIKDQITASGIVYLGVPLLNALVTGDHLFNVFEKGHYVTAGVDLTLLFAGVGLVYTGMKLPSSRPASANKRVNREVKTQEALPVEQEV